MASLLYPNKALILPREPPVIFRRDQPHPFHDLSDNHFSFPCFPLLPTPKPKAVFVLGSSGTGKSKLAISLALRFSGEIINSDKMQFYDGLPVITNKVTPEECAGVPHHLLGGIHPEADFTAAKFCRLATAISDQITARNHLPIIAGGSNSYIKELIDVDFTRRYDCCFIWMDAEQDVLDEFVAERVDKMVEKGLVEEARGIFDFEADYTKGVRRSIGVPELHQFFRREAEVDELERRMMLEEAIGEIKASTCRLTRVQREKIRRFEADDGWWLNRVDATAALVWRSAAVGGLVWEETVVGPSIETVRRFLGGGGGGIVGRCGGAVEFGEENMTAEVVASTK
ncbi:adenylate isopentenyltransferase 3, chloroplastic-like [Phalaenopsis equestris]|uniref:adenylate isopentenyltransferase 3, chloroplastic-like n=1 Tax=Phalaenopsis equestris TaxID=78828 RepID=UPI0009E4EEF4|nr:adenylate isopentenyltransferase 3, chloroplastic-like [Phalaenopsis equestris]